MYKLSWVLLVFNLLIAIALGIYPHTQKETKQEENQQPLYIFSGLLILSVTGQAIEKGVALRRNRGKLTGQDFVETYTNTLIEAVNTIKFLPLEQDEVQSAQKLLLKSISSIIKLYYGKKIGLEINANLMIPHQVIDFVENGQFKPEVKFADPLRNPETYKCVLALTVSSTPLVAVPQNFCIPVDSSHDRLLFGAPQAYALGKETVVKDINDIAELEQLLRGQPEAVATAELHFLKQMTYKSFVSLPLLFSSKTIGVINIQSNQSCIFGRKNERLSIIRKYIDPLVDILAILASPKSIKSTTV